MQNYVEMWEIDRDKRIPIVSEKIRRIKQKGVITEQEYEELQINQLLLTYLRRQKK